MTYQKLDIPEGEAPEIEITPEMIKAGAMVIAMQMPDDGEGIRPDYQAVARGVFLAMRKRRRDCSLDAS